MRNPQDRLRLVTEGPAAGDIEPGVLRAAELPLGPLAGESIPLWITPSSGTIHLDESCAPKSAKPGPPLVQPKDGSFADCNWPERAHCRPVGPIGEYIAAVELLLRASHAFTEARGSWSDGLAGFSLLRYGGGSRVSLDVPAELEPAAARLAEKVDAFRREVLGCSEYFGYGDRLELAMAAAWVSSGRTSGRYQPRYELALEVTQWAIDRTLEAVKVAKAEPARPPRDKAGWDELVADVERSRDRSPVRYVSARELDVTQFWFDLVADGVPAERATTALARRLVDKLLWRVRHGFDDEEERRTAAAMLPVWSLMGDSIGAALAGYLDGIVAPLRRDRVVVVWDPGWALVGDLGEVVALSVRAVRAFDGESELRVALLPATARLYLDDERRHCWVFDPPFMAGEETLVAFAEALVGAKGRLVDVPGEHMRPAGRALRAMSLPDLGRRGWPQAAAMLEAASDRRPRSGSDSPAVLRPEDFDR
jgi:hypothetical protein